MTDESHYLIEPPPGLLPAAPATPAAPAPPHADDDSGTRKLNPSRQAVPARPPVSTGIPFGTPAPADPTPHADEETVLAGPGRFAEADDKTVVSRAPRAAGWRLTLADGQSVVVDTAVVLGRRPTAPEGRVAASLPIADPAKSVSKSHALVEVDAAGLWITDLGSTNGTFITRPGDVLRQLDPHVRTAVPADSDLELGEYHVQVARG